MSAGLQNNRDNLAMPPLKILTPMVESCAQHLMEVCAEEAPYTTEFSKDLAEHFCFQWLQTLNSWPRQSDGLNGIWAAEHMFKNTGKGILCRAIKIEVPIPKKVPEQDPVIVVDHEPGDIKIEEPVEHPDNGLEEGVDYLDVDPAVWLLAVGVVVAVGILILEPPLLLGALAF